MGSRLDNHRRLEQPLASSEQAGRRGLRQVVFALAMLVGGSGLPALAQLGLPSLPGPRMPSLDPPIGIDQRLERTAGRAGRGLDPASLASLRKLKIRELLRRHGDRIEVDSVGEPIVRGEVLAVSPGAGLLAAARGAGFVILRERPLAGLGISVVALRPPPGVSTRRALERLRALDPAGAFDFNHIYTESGESAGTQAGAAAPAASGFTPGSDRSAVAAPGAAAAGRLGLIDGGVDLAAALLQQAQVRSWGCEGRQIASSHGTAVASLMVGRGAGFQGAAPGLTLYAADVYCNEAAGGAVDRIADALAWLGGERVAVINISLVGPPNHLLEQLMNSMQARGHTVVAAVGNDGPAAPPLYPAAYPGVIGVTAVDARRRVLPEAARGAQVDFAAPGADMAAAGAGGFTIVRGTSFAAPLVSGLLAEQLAEPEPEAGGQALADLTAAATDLGASGRDPMFGHGLVGEHLRVNPAQVLSPSELARLRRGR